jgi:diguanylate cyclase (GGDEF)-like protein
LLRLDLAVNIALRLDLRTMMLTMACINLLFAAMLALVSLHSGKVKGARQWAVGMVLLGAGYSSAGLLVDTPPPAVMVIMAMGIGFGLGLMFNGIEAFKDQPCSYRLTLVLAIGMGVQTYWFLVVRNDVQGRITANWLVHSLVNLACARALFVRVAQPLRTAYWLAGASFLALGSATLVRVGAALFAPAHTVFLYGPGKISPGVFMVASLAQMALAFGLILMINYRLASDLRQLASTDALTGVLNRGSIEKELSRQVALADRSGAALALMMIDVDHFKRINDSHGHPAGDEVLRQLAVLLRSLVRQGDAVGRYGGEEFCIVLPGTSAPGAAVLAERLLQRYADLRVVWGGISLHGTVSIGIADVATSGHAVAPLVAAADRALYQAKDAGRNRVVLHTADEPEQVQAQSMCA